MNTQFIFPETFDVAKKRLLRKFPLLDRAMIEDSIQYASIEYWIQEKDKNTAKDGELLGWFLKVARNYLLKEIRRAEKLCTLSDFFHLHSVDKLEESFMNIDFYSSMLKKLTSRKRFVLIQHGMGYSLKEIADMQEISLDAMKQLHARARKTLIANLDLYNKKV